MITYTMVCTCDGCNARLAQSEPSASKIDSARHAIDKHLKSVGAISQKVMSRPTKHFCKDCADGKK